MNPARYLDWIYYMLLFAGALNLGIWGIFELDVIAQIFGGSTALLSKILFVLIGLSALYEIGAWKAIRHRFCQMAA